MPNAKEWERLLAVEGFGNFFVWHDGPGAYYPEHTHARLTAHVILEGEMILTMLGETRTYEVGERADVPAGAAHSARMGAGGCKYLIGEK